MAFHRQYIGLALKVICMSAILRDRAMQNENSENKALLSWIAIHFYNGCPVYRSISRLLENVTSDIGCLSYHQLVHILLQ